MSLLGPNSNKLLIITSSGGGGLLQAAVAKEQEVKMQNPHIQIVKKDMLKDWLWSSFGKFCIAYWNGAQRRGSVRMQKIVMQHQWILDFFAWPYVFYQTLRTLFREDIDRIIDTQVIGTAAIIKAIRVFNRVMHKRVVLEKIVVDLPTKEAIHYFRSIKKLSKKDKSLVQLKTIAPLLEEGESAEEFWQKHCGLSEKEIHYEGLNVRQSFKKLQGQERSLERLIMPIHFGSREELALMRSCADRGTICYQVQDDALHCTVSPKDRVFTILLGSQPAEQATLNYVLQFLSIANEAQAKATPTHLFVFCSDHAGQGDTLFRQVVDCVARVQQYPRWLSIIPFSFQTDDVIALLFHRSDLTCTRSGGQTAMELMAVSRGEIWIHSEAKKRDKDFDLEELLNGIPGWEGASALYLYKQYGAKIVTPEIMAPHARRQLFG